MERITARSEKNGMAYLVKVKSNEQEIEGAYNTLKCIQESWEELAKCEDLAESYGIDVETMLTLAKSQIDTAKENVRLQEALDKMTEGRDYCKELLDKQIARNEGLSKQLLKTKGLVQKMSEFMAEHEDCLINGVDCRTQTKCTDCIIKHFEGVE